MRIFVGRDVGIGDILLINPIVEALKKATPGAYIIFGCGPEPIPQLLETNPYVDELLVFPDNGNPVNALRRAEENIRRHVAENTDRYDKVLLLFPHDHYAAECLERRMHIQDYYAEMAGLQTIAPGVKLWTTDQDVETAQRLVEAHGLKGFAAISHKTLYTMGPKQWPLEQFQEVIDHLANQGIPVAVFGSSKDEPMVNCVNILGQPLRVVAEMLRHSRLMIGLDSGLTHLMAIYDIPVLALHTSSLSQVTGTRSKRAVFLKGDRDNKDYSIKTPSVIQALNRILEGD